MTSPIDVLLLQLGTPDAPTAGAVRPYLRQFLTDPRVIELPAILRWMLVNLIIAPFRAPKSAAKYRRIWDPQTGSPLLDITRKQTAALQAKLGERFRVNFAMRYGNPGMSAVVGELCRRKSERMVVVPMFPQYSATTTASGFDALFDELKRQRVMPSVRLIRDYHDEPAYLDALEGSLRRALDAVRGTEHEPETCIISFHGIPIDYIKRGDPYFRQSAITGKALATRMGWTKGSWKLCFQSRLGGQKWLLPYTDETLKELGRKGLKRVLVIQPGFTADCLETIDEIGREGVEEFESTGGEHLVRVPCLNDDPAFIDCLAGLVRREAGDWLTAGAPGGTGARSVWERPPGV